MIFEHYIIIHWPSLMPSASIALLFIRHKIEPKLPKALFQEKAFATNNVVNDRITNIALLCAYKKARNWAAKASRSEGLVHKLSIAEH